MSGSTIRTIAIGVGVALLIMAFGFLGFFLARDDSSNVVASVSTSTTTSTSTTVPATTAASSPKQVDTTSPPTTGKEGEPATGDDPLVPGGATAQVDVVTCDSARQGSAFLSNPDTAVTDLALVDGAATIALTFNDQSSEAVIIGRDVSLDLAVLRLETPIDEDSAAGLGLTAEQSERAGELLTLVSETPERVALAFCVGSVDLANIDEIAAELIVADTDHDEIPAVQRTYAVYSQSINSGRAENAFGVLGPAITTDNTAEQWAEGQRTSLLWDWRIRSVEEFDGGLRVRSVFTSTQEAEFGFDGESTCTRWDITHDLVSGEFRDRTFWLINRSRSTTDRGPQDCLNWNPELITREQLVLPDVGTTLSRSDRLGGGSIHEWDVGFGPSADDEDGDGAPETLVVTLDSTNDDFDPYLLLLDQNGVIVAENDDRGDDSLNSRVQFDVSSYQVVSVRVRDLTNRGGGEYTITFTSEAG